VLVNETGTDPGAPSSATAESPTTPKSAGHLYQVVHVAAALTEAATVRDVAGVVVEQVMPVVNAQAAVMFTVTGSRLHVIGNQAYPPGIAALLEGAPLDITFSAGAQASTTGRALFLSSADEINQLFPRLSDITGKQAWALLPLAVYHHPVGCCAFAYDKERRFGANERAVLTSLAGLIAQALDRARLYDEQHLLARGLQEALLPQTLPQHPRLEAAARYLPATRGMDIGGDFYDLVRINDTTVIAVIGDVEGHNVAAAATMGTIRTAIRAYISAGTTPDQVLTRTSRLLDDLQNDLLASCLYAQIDLAHNRVQLASAGHLPPLLRLPGQPCSAAEIAPGPLLGVTPNPEYPLTELALPPGSLLGLYTDGLVEAPGIDLDQQLAKCAAVLNRDGNPEARQLDTLIDMLLAQSSQDFPRRDDIAVLLLHTRP
jgi:serine phosphatase RsbU (regulator of sigma subunit)